MTPSLRAAAALVLLSGGCSPDGWSGDGVKIAPGTPGEASSDEPARAILARYLPHRVKDAAFVHLVDTALRSSRGQKIAVEGAKSVAELQAIRGLIVDEGLPSVFIGIPLWESYLDTEAVSGSCAAGAWQLMPETALELGLEVGECHIGDRLWSPEPGTASSPTSVYRRSDNTCAISHCEVDDRTDIARSTVGALRLLAQYYGAADVKPKPDAPALTILAYNIGLGAVRGSVSKVDDPFVELETCAAGGCGHLGKVAAHYVPGVTAAAGLAVCAAAKLEESPFADEAATTMCQSLEAAGLIPEEIGDDPEETAPALADAANPK